MISKAKLRELAGYKQLKTCINDNVFVVEGVKMVDELLLSGFKVRTVCANLSWFSQHSDAISDGIERYEVGAAELERLSNMKSPNEVWALAERPASCSPTAETCTFASEDKTLVLALDHIQDPGNMGTIIRTADWFGIRHIVCSPDTVSCFNPKVVQASMGGIFRTQIHYTNLADYLRQSSLPVYGALLEGSNAFAADLPQGAILVIGNESKGISPEIQQLVQHRLTIPNIGGTCESLNASVAAGILCSLFIAQSWKKN